MARKTSSPTVSAMITGIHFRPTRRSQGSHSMPSATGMTPDVDADHRHESVEAEAGRRRLDGAGMACPMVAPSEVSSAIS